MNLSASYAACEHLARTHYENFPVASWLLPRRLRPHVAAIYAFARTADDIADEPGRTEAERLALLASYRDRLRSRQPHFSLPTPDVRRPPPGQRPSPDARPTPVSRLPHPDQVASPDARPTPASRLPHPDQVPSPDAQPTPASRLPPPDARPTPASRLPPPDARPTPVSRLPPPDLIFPALFDTIERFDLPDVLFTDLLSAFEQDVTTSRYRSWDDVLDYCRRSANPVGRIVLRLNGYHQDALDSASDAVCTALQLVNFWQDLAIDWSRGRLYVPSEVWQGHGARLEDLDRGAWTGAWQAALQDCGARTRALFTRGRSVCDDVGGRLRFELRATWLGGSRILDRLERAEFDVVQARPSLGLADAMVIGCRTLAWRRAS